MPGEPDHLKAHSVRNGGERVDCHELSEVDAGEAASPLSSCLGRDADEDEDGQEEERREDANYRKVGKEVQSLRPQRWHRGRSGDHAEQVPRNGGKDFVEVVSHEREEHGDSRDELEAKDDGDESSALVPKGERANVRILRPNRTIQFRAVYI